MYYALESFCCYCTQALLAGTQDIMYSWLDSKHGSEVTDNSIFADLPRQYETEFHEDMDALNVNLTLLNIIMCGFSTYNPITILFINCIIDWCNKVYLFCHGIRCILNCNVDIVVWCAKLRMTTHYVTWIALLVFLHTWFFHPIGFTKFLF